MIRVFFFLTFFLLTAIGEPQPLDQKSRHITVKAGSTKRKPWEHKSSPSLFMSFSAAIFTKPVYIDQHYGIQPGVIKNWEWNAKNNSFIFTLDKTLKFGKDRELVARDLEFAIIKNFLRKEGNYKRDYFYDIKGIENIREGGVFESNSYEGIKIISKHKMAIFLNKPNPNFIFSMGPALPPVAPVEDFKNDYFDFKGIPRGTGKYKVIWSDPKSSLVRVKRKFEDKGSLAKVPLTIDFINHSIDSYEEVDIALGSTSAFLIRSDNLNFRHKYGLIPSSVFVLGFNYKSRRGKSKIFRKAISLAINRKDLLGGRAFSITHELVPKMYLGRSESKFEYNPRESKRLIKKHFPNLSSSQKPLDIIFHGLRKNSKPQRSLVKLKDQLKSVGIFIKLKPRLYARFNNSSEVMGFFGKGTVYTDPISSYSPYISKLGSGSGYTDIGDDRALKYFENAKKTADKVEKSRSLVLLSKHFQENYRVLPLYQKVRTYSLGKRIKSIGVSDILFSLDFDKVEMR